MEILKVGTKSNPNSVAGALANAFREKGIVEAYDVSITSPVVLQSVMDNVLSKAFRHLISQKLPIRISKTVYTLLHISDNEVIKSAVDAVLQQRTEVVPLHT